MIQTAALALVGIALAVSCGSVLAVDDVEADVEGEGAPLSFDFLQDPPGTLLSIGTTRLHIVCSEAAEQAVTVIFEAGLGGNALEWGPVVDVLTNRVRTCTYDRAGYGWSDPTAPPRHALRLAYELDLLLDAAQIDGPLILVAHSFGGFVVRLLAERRVSDIAGLVLIDTSHEQQFSRLEKPGGKPMMPRNRQFVISRNEPPPNLPLAIRRKLSAFSRMRKTYSATHGEMATFRESAAQVDAARQRRNAPYPFPVTVIRRGLDLYGDGGADASRTAVWTELQKDLATLGEPSRLVVAWRSGHHVHADQPELVANEILRLVRAVDEQ